MVQFTVSTAATEELRRAWQRAIASYCAQARSLLWACRRLGAWGVSVGLDPVPEVLLHPSVIERYVIVGMVAASEPARRTARANLRFVARRAARRLNEVAAKLEVASIQAFRSAETPPQRASSPAAAPPNRRRSSGEPLR